QCDNARNPEGHTCAALSPVGKPVRSRNVPGGASRSRYCLPGVLFTVTSARHRLAGRLPVRRYSGRCAGEDTRATPRSTWGRSQVPGIHYLSKVGKVVSTPPSYLPMEQLPSPALDTVAELCARDGVITAEFSRGCQYNKCSFCPRSHKGGVWRSIPVTSMLQQW